MKESWSVDPLKPPDKGEGGREERDWEREHRSRPPDDDDDGR